MMNKPTKVNLECARMDPKLSRLLENHRRSAVPGGSHRKAGKVAGLIFCLLSMILTASFALAEHCDPDKPVNLVVNVARFLSKNSDGLPENHFFIPARHPLDLKYEVSIGLAHLVNPSNLGEIKALTMVLRGKDDENSLSLDHSGVFLKEMFLDWVGDESAPQIVQKWSQEHLTMTDGQNLNVVRVLMTHSEVIGGEASSDKEGYMIMLHLKSLCMRNKRSLDDDCSKLKSEALWNNKNMRKPYVLGYKMLSENTVCTFVSSCKEGFPIPGGCDNGTANGSNDQLFLSDVEAKGVQEPVPMADLEGVCSIGDSKIKNCLASQARTVQVLFYRIQGLSGYYIGRHSLVLGPIYTSLNDFTCNGTASSHCQGDGAFKKTFPESGSDLNCHCALSTSKTVVHLMVNGKAHRLDYAFYQPLIINYEKTSDEDLQCRDCDISCNQGHITMEYGMPIELIEFCAGKFCMDLKPRKTFPVPLSLAAMSNSYDYYIRFSDNKEKSGTIQCKVEDLCPLIDCHLCLEKFKNPHCYNILDKVNFMILIMTWFILLAILVKVLKVIIYGARIITSIIKFLYRLLSFMARRVLSLLGFQVLKLKETISKTTEMTDGTQQVIEHSRTKTVIKKMPMPTYIKTIVILCLLIPLVTCCSDSQTLDSRSMDCLMEDKALKCATKSSASINVAPVGQSSCFLFKTADGQTSGSLSIKTISLDLVCNKEILYWTFDASSTFDQMCYCSGSSTGYGNKDSCLRYNNKTSCGAPLRCSQALGHSQCKTAKGGWEQGCFSYDSMYCYYNAEVGNPSKKTYEVSHCSSFYWQASIEVVIQTIDGEEKITGKLNPGSKLGFTGGSIVLTGASVPPLPILSQCFIKSDEVVLVSDCVKDSGITPGKIGEVQCKTEKSAKNPSYTECSMSPLIHKIDTLGGSLDYSSFFMRPSTIRKRLPLMSGGYLIKNQNGIVTVNLNYVALMSLKLSLNGLSLIPYSINSKCSAKIISVKGCVSCLTGAVIRIKAKTEEGNAKAVLDCPSLKAQIPIRLTPKDETIRVNAHFEVGSISEVCKLKCPGNTLDLNMEANLVSDVEVSRVFEDHLSDFSETAANWFKGFLGQFGLSLLLPSMGVMVIGSLIVLRIMVLQVKTQTHQKKW